MRAKTFAKTLAALADGMHGVGVADAARSVRTILPAFQRSVSVSELIEKARALPAKTPSPPPCGEGLGVGGGVKDVSLRAPYDDRLSDVLSAVEPYSNFIASVATRALQTDWKYFLTLCREHRDMSIRDFLAALDDAFNPPSAEPYPVPGESLVDAFVRRLKETIHDSEKFPIVFDALSNRKDLKRADIVEIASRFAFKMAKDTKRDVALARIQRQHNASEGARAKDRATRGKSAA